MYDAGTGGTRPFQRWAELGHRLPDVPYTTEALAGRIVVFPSAVDQCWEVSAVEPVGLDLRRITGTQGDWRWLWTPDPACESPIVLRTAPWPGDTFGRWEPTDSPYADTYDEPEGEDA